MTVTLKAPITQPILASCGLLAGCATTRVKAKVLIGTGPLLTRQGYPIGTSISVVVAIVLFWNGDAAALGDPVPTFVLLPDLALILSALVDAKGTSCESTFEPMPAGEMTGDSPAQPVLETTAGEALRLRRV
ncbi:hypothetical protein JQC81_23220 [Microvirga arabica]|uniref:hypothetical protein n=1 Tax=Microvirga arabica TaxID=1128671 RepID=UPI00362060FC|nr:hypothetical protein [Microvirga arabica]